MSLFITSLNSGSNGNCYYVGNDNEAVLIDAGISCKETEKRLLRLGLSMGRVKAVFVSHEHTDHTFGLSALSKKYQLPVYITETTLKYSGLDIEQSLIIPFNAKEPILIGQLSIKAFQKFHDAIDPHSFTVACDKVKVGIFTDIGIACNQVVYHFKQCNAAILEANYDEKMLADGSYPYFLKKRITGDKGHLSNTDALQLFITHKPTFMSHLLLGHLSKNNNCPDLVKELFNRHAGKTNIIVASRYEETPLFHVDNINYNFEKRAIIPIRKKSLQLSIFNNYL